MPGGPKFETYTRLARSCGTTIPRLKTLLREVGYLDGSRATDRAIEDGACRMRAIDPEKARFATTSEEFPTWNREVVLRLAEKAGIRTDPRFRPANRHKCSDVLGEISRIVEDRYEDRDEVLAAFSKEARFPVYEYHRFEGHQAIMDLDEIEAGRLPADHFATAFAPFLAELDGSRIPASDRDVIRRIVAGVDGFARRLAGRRAI